MSKKSKTSEINDIIDSSYAEPDYSNDYNDEVNNFRFRNSYHSSRDNGNPFSKISTISPLAFAPAPAPAPATTCQTNPSNIFMKYTCTRANTENVDKSLATPTKTEIKNIEEEFPSLGGSKKSIASAPVPVPVPIPIPMNFKKIVETKKPVEVQAQVAQTKPKSNQGDYYNRFKVYEQVKYYSEKTAISKIYSSGYSDDEDIDDMDDMDDVYNYDDDE